MSSCPALVKGKEEQSPPSKALGGNGSGGFVPTPLGPGQSHFSGDVHKQLPGELLCFNPVKRWVNKASLGKANQGKRLSKYRQGFGVFA